MMEMLTKFQNAVLILLTWMMALVVFLATESSFSSSQRRSSPLPSSSGDHQPLEIFGYCSWS